MAKVTGPLFSISASGAIAKSLVHFPWKGLAVVRKWLIPANPKTAAQGDARQILGGLGRACSVIDTKSQFAVYAREVAGPGQTWVSRIVKYIRETHLDTVSNYDAYITAIEALGDLADWKAKAAGIGLVQLAISPRTAGNPFQPFVMLYALAQFGYDQYTLDNGKFPVSPYTANPTGWNAAAMQEMIDHFAAL